MFAVGFGDTETAKEAAIEREITELAQRLYDEHVASGGDYMFMPDDYVDRLSDAVAALSKASQEQAESYQSAPPESGRYCRWWSHLTRSASTIVFVLSIHHINRRHPFSPDGWAVFQTKRFVCIEHWDLDRSRREAAKSAELAAV